MVIVKRRLRGCFADVRSVYAGAGLMGIMVSAPPPSNIPSNVLIPNLSLQGNKGAAAIRLSYTPADPSSASASRDSLPLVLTFVNAHLAAFDEMVERRHADFHVLGRRLVFPDAGGGAPVGIYEADALFWMVSAYIYMSLRLWMMDDDWMCG